MHREKKNQLSFINLVFDELPDDASHLISIHLHHRLVHFDAPCGI